MQDIPRMLLSQFKSWPFNAMHTNIKHILKSMPYQILNCKDCCLRMEFLIFKRGILAPLSGMPLAAVNLIHGGGNDD